MEMEIPHDLIKQAQISIYKEARLPFTEQQHCTTSLSLEETIADIDRSPDHFNCTHCKARLLRDHHKSLICVFCGRQQPVAQTRQPIKFRNTIGYCWLLDALDCDGSEVVGFSVDNKESTRGQCSQKDEKKLSDLLDLEIRWRLENERIEGVFSSEEKSVLDRVGVYIDDNDDDFFPDVRATTVSNMNEIKKPLDPVQSGASQVQGSVSLPDNVQPPKIGLKESEGKTSSSSFSGWEANFQFPGKEDAGSLPEVQPVPEKDVITTESSDFQGEKSTSLFENVGHSQSAAGRSTENETTDDFSGWDAEFQSADTGAINKGLESPDPFPSSEVDLSAHMDTVFGSMEKSNEIEARDNPTTSPSTNDNWFQDDMWGNFNSGISNQDANYKTTENSKVDRDAEDEKIPSFDNIDWEQIDNWQSSSVKQPKDSAMPENDESFDVWSDFTSSAKSVDPSFSLRDQNATRSQLSHGQSIEIDFFTSNNNSQSLNHDSFSQTDFFSDMSINKSSQREANLWETEDSDRDREASETANTQGTIIASGKEEGLFHTPKTPNANDAESLISQMHDLSFMLENHISIPKS